MSYSLKLFDEVLLKFNVIENLSDPVLDIVWLDEERKHLLPITMDPSPEGLARWIRHRSIPKNRANVNAFLAKCGLNINRPMDVMNICNGLSVNDSYWIVNDDFKKSFDKCNLYENNFSNVLAWIAFTGYGSSVRSTFASSPEFTTNEILAPAPLFDHGNSLFNLAGEENRESAENLKEYVDTLLPCVYEDFFEAAKAVLDEDLKEKIRRLLNFRIEKTGRYNYSRKKISLLEDQIQERACRLLG